MELKEYVVFTEDVRRTREFYRAFLGAEPAVEEDSFASFPAGGVGLLVLEAREASPEAPPQEDHVSFAVSDVDGAYGELTEAGATPACDPRDYDWGRAAYLRDPDGRLLGLEA